MGTFLCSALAAAALWQQPGSADSTPALWARVQRDAGDASTWLELGHAYQRRAGLYHAHPDTAGPLADTAWARAALDTLDVALERAATLGAGSPVGDTAQLRRLSAVALRARLRWELGGRDAAAQTWGGLGAAIRPAPVLEELGENLLRACPRGGVLLTAAETDSDAASYLQLRRGLRPDLLVLPLEAWRSDSVFRDRLATELRLPRPAPGAEDGDARLHALAARRPLCASMGFAVAPEIQPRVRWEARPLVWVAGAAGGGDRVPPQDFVFAALRLALDTAATWTQAAVTVYRRAVSAAPALCGALAVYGVRDEVGCR